MKKITFILLALISGTVFAQQNKAKGTAEVIATIAQPLTITSDGNLDFATIASPEEAVDVVLSPSNVRTIPTGLSVPANTTTSVPTFTVSKEEALTYSVVTSSTDLALTGQTDITIKDITTSLENLTSVTAESFTVGATIGLNASQGPGDYKGEVAVTVSYE